MGNYCTTSINNVEIMKTKYLYGWIPDKNDNEVDDNNTKYFSIHQAKYLNGIPDCNLKSKCPPVYISSNLNSCVSNSVAFIYHYTQKKLDINISPSRLFLYYNTRMIENTINKDVGCQIKNCLESINLYGVCNENEYPYKIDNVFNKPPVNFYNPDIKIKFSKIEQTIDQIKLALNNNYPIIFGFNVFESFESDEIEKTGIVPYPNEEENILGGHCAVIIGCDSDKEVFIIRNCWGFIWGDKGYFYLPYQYVINTNFCDNFWIIDNFDEN